MSNLRNSASLWQMHVDGNCPDLCAYCRAIENFDPPERGGRELLVTQDYEER